MLKGVRGTAPPHEVQVVLIGYVSCATGTVAREVEDEGAEVAVNTEGIVQGLAGEGVQGLGVGRVFCLSCRWFWLSQGRHHVNESAADAVGTRAACGKSAANLQEQGKGFVVFIGNSDSSVQKSGGLEV